MAISGHENSTDIKFTFKQNTRYLVRDNDTRSNNIIEVKCLEVAELYIKLEYVNSGIKFWTDNKSAYPHAYLVRFQIICVLPNIMTV